MWAATGDAIARLDEADGGDRFVSLAGSGAQCLAVDPSDPDTAFAGLREQGLRRTRDAGETWEDAELPEQGVFLLAISAADGAVYAGCEPSRLFRSDDGGDSWRALDALLGFSPPAQPGASRRGPGRHTSAGSRRAHTTRTCCQSGSSSAASCARPTAARAGK